MRVWQYLANSSLWVDEAALARNIADRSPGELLQPLDYAQVAPAGFLLVEKAFVSLLGDGELALRLFPLLCGLAALPIFWRLASRVLAGWWGVYALGLFALATPLVYFSSQVKQYSSDVAATVVVLAAAVWLRSGSGADLFPRARRAAIAGAAVAWLSQPVAFVLAGSGATLAWCAWRERRPAALRASLLVCAAWAASSGLAAALAVRNVSPADRAYLDWYWSNGLMPFPPASFADALWVWDRLTWLFGAFVTGLRRTNGGLGYPWSQVFVGLTMVGYFAIWRVRRDMALILLMPVVVVILAAAFQLYPLSGRVVTFLIPVLLIPVAAGAGFVIDALPARVQLLAPVLLAIAIGSPIYATLLALPPERTEHLRPVMEAVSRHRLPGDAVYVYYGAGQAFLYYAPRFGLTPRDYVLGRCSVTDQRAYLRDLDAFRGRSRLWLVSTHARLAADEFRTMVGYLDSIGRRVQAFEQQATSRVASQAAYGLLYDLSDAGRLASATADTYPVPPVPVDPAFARWGCYGTQAASAGL